MTRQYTLLSAGLLAGLIALTMPAASLAYNVNNGPRDSAALHALYKEGIATPDIYQALRQRLSSSGFGWRNSLTGWMSGNATTYQYNDWKGQIKAEKKQIYRLQDDGLISSQEADHLMNRVKAQQNGFQNTAFGQNGNCNNNFGSTAFGGFNPRYVGPANGFNQQFGGNGFNLPFGGNGFNQQFAGQYDAYNNYQQPSMLSRLRNSLGAF